MARMRRASLGRGLRTHCARQGPGWGTGRLGSVEKTVHPEGGIRARHGYGLWKKRALEGT
jgi:hypothetical protein